MDEGSERAHDQATHTSTENAPPQSPAAHPSAVDSLASFFVSGQRYLVMPGNVVGIELKNRHRQR